MKYLVMECNRGYAVVLDNEGRFLKVANLNYEIGQQVDEVIEMNLHLQSVNERGRGLKKFLGTVAACLCLMLGSWYYLLIPEGIVQIQINPHVQMNINRLDYVISLEGLNADGDRLVDGVRVFGKKADSITNELAEKALNMGFLEEGGRMTLTMWGENEEWCTSMEKHLADSLQQRFEGEFEIVFIYVEHKPQREPTKPQKSEGISIEIPVNPADGDSDYGESLYGDSFYEDDSGYGDDVADEDDRDDSDYGDKVYDDSGDDDSDYDDKVSGDSEDNDSEYSQSSYLQTEDGITDYGVQKDR